MIAILSCLAISCDSTRTTPVSNCSVKDIEDNIIGHTFITTSIPQCKDKKFEFINSNKCLYSDKDTLIYLVSKSEMQRLYRIYFIDENNESELRSDFGIGPDETPSVYLKFGYTTGCTPIRITFGTPEDILYFDKLTH